MLDGSDGWAYDLKFSPDGSLLAAASVPLARKTRERESERMVDVIMPPTIGAAIGFMTSDHRKYCLLRRFLRARQRSKYSKVMDHRSIAASLVGLLI